MITNITIYEEGPDWTFRPDSNNARMIAIIRTAKAVSQVGDHVRLTTRHDRRRPLEFGPTGLYLAAQNDLFGLVLYEDFTGTKQGATTSDARGKGKPRRDGDVPKVRTRAHGRARSAGILGHIKEAGKPDRGTREAGGKGPDQAPRAK